MLSSRAHVRHVSSRIHNPVWVSKMQTKLVNSLTTVCDMCMTRRPQHFQVDVSSQRSQARSFPGPHDRLYRSRFFKSGALNITRLAIVAAFVGVFAGMAAPVFAQTANRQGLGQFSDWGAYTANIDGAKTCYVVSQPKDSAPKGVNRDPVLFFITRRPSENVASEASILIGYPFREGAPASIEVGDQKYILHTVKDHAWLENGGDEAKLVTAMKAGSTMVVKGTSSRGTNTRDRYSLIGVTAALEAIEKACQITAADKNANTGG